MLVIDPAALSNHYYIILLLRVCSCYSPDFWLSVRARNMSFGAEMSEERLFDVHHQYFPDYAGHLSLGNAGFLSR